MRLKRVQSNQALRDKKDGARVCWKRWSPQECVSFHAVIILLTVSRRISYIMISACIQLAVLAHQQLEPLAVIWGLWFGEGCSHAANSHREDSNDSTSCGNQGTLILPTFSRVPRLPPTSDVEQSARRTDHVHPSMASMSVGIRVEDSRYLGR